MAVAGALGFKVRGQDPKDKGNNAVIRKERRDAEA